MASKQQSYKPYKTFDFERAVGNPIGAYKDSDFNELSKTQFEEDDADMGGDAIPSAALPNPITDRTILFSDGTVSDPAVSWAAETSTGRYRIGSNNPGESVGGTLTHDWNATRMRYATGYRVYLGATADIQSGASDRMCIEDSANLHLSATILNGSNAVTAGAAWIARSDSGTNCGVGVNNSGYSSVPVFQANEGFVQVHHASLARNLHIANRTNGPIRFTTADTERARFTNLGVLCLNSTAPVGSEMLSVTGSIYSSTLSTTGVLYSAGGVITSNPTNFSWTSGSNTLTITGTSTHVSLVNGAQNSSILVNSSGYLDVTPTGDQFRVIRSRVGLTLYSVVSNQAASGASNACFYAGVVAGSTGEPFSTWDIPGSTAWSCGPDNSEAGDPWVLCPATSISTSYVVSISTGGLATWKRSDAVTTPTFDLIQGSTGDAAIRYALGTSHSYAEGVDNTDDAFKVSYAASGSAVLGTNDRLTISTSGLVTVTQYMNVGTTTDAAAQGDFAAGATQKLFYDESLGFLQLTSTVAKQLRLAYTSGSVYADLRTDTDGLLNITSTGEGVIISGSYLDVTGSTTAIYVSYSGSVYTSLNTDSSGNFLITPTGPDIDYVKSYASGAIRMVFFNTDNTTGTAGATMLVATGGASGGDPIVHFLVSGVTQYAMGIDNNVNDMFKIAASGALGTSDIFAIETGGTVWFGTHSAIGAELVTGYITIKDIAGNTRKLAVVS